MPLDKFKPAVDRSTIPNLVSLTVHNVTDTDGDLLSSLPRTFCFLSLPMDTYPKQLRGPSRYVWSGTLPSLKMEDVLRFLVSLVNLEELRVAARGVVSPTQFSVFIEALPKLKIFELHNWPFEDFPKNYNTNDFRAVISGPQTVEELRLNLNLSDMFHFPPHKEALFLASYKSALNISPQMVHRGYGE
ncbi:hypothetical protein M422DRAFT_264180 [Sphaerobolus stellatus SS14]|uniref:Uncharacterized protein n=1 Tax=Sphaerobolus stellatus (strain SS14) TaxID=990650 RepID=A0A0C9UFZ4_SPHS4|nr:hypothetical protein M422DRAFT_264180 [Sphaerobolus stellatus SS14]